MVLKLSKPVVVVALLFAASGCGLFYDNSYEGPGFTIYSDRNPEFLEGVGKKLSRIYLGYRELFDLPPDRLGTTSIVLEGNDTDIVDASYSPSVLGYYVPLLNYICVDTSPHWARSETMLQQILLHEVAHHFVVTEFPAASRQCWLNEGLAGNLEMSLFEGARFEYPLLNPPLFQLAQASLYDANTPLQIEEFIDMSWSEFHNSDAKERNYAMAWSIVYFVLERYLSRDVPLGDRIETLYALDREIIYDLEEQWLAFLRGFDITGHLLRLASSRGAHKSLTARWAVAQLATTRSGDDLRVLTGLGNLFDDPDEEKRVLSYLGFLRILKRNPHSYVLCEQRVRDGLEHIGDVLEDPAAPLATRQTLKQALAAENARSEEKWLSGLAPATASRPTEARPSPLAQIAGKATMVPAVPAAEGK